MRRRRRVFDTSNAKPEQRQMIIRTHLRLDVGLFGWLTLTSLGTSFACLAKQPPLQNTVTFSRCECLRRIFAKGRGRGGGEGKDNNQAWLH